MAGRVKKYGRELRVLSLASPAFAKKLMKAADKGLVDCLSECAVNILKGNVALNQTQKKKLQRHKYNLRNLAGKKVPLTEKRRILQKGGFLGLLLKPILSVLGGLFQQ